MQAVTGAESINLRCVNSCFILDEVEARCCLPPHVLPSSPHVAVFFNGIPAEGRGSAFWHSRGRGLMLEPPVLYSRDIGKMGNPRDWRQYVSAFLFIQSMVSAHFPSAAHRLVAIRRLSTALMGRLWK